MDEVDLFTSGKNALRLPCEARPLPWAPLTHWVVEAIAVAYTSQGLQLPEGLRAHSTRGVSA